MRRSTLLILLTLVVPAAVTADDAAPPFPKTGLMPKEEIGALRFLAAHPEYDGRGVTVAVFDTGVDPTAPGLQTTTDGQPKIVDLVDGTGSGDVDTTRIVTATDGRLTGRTGRTLTIDPNWKNPTGQYRLGMKAAYDFFPAPLVSRLKRDRREAFLKTHHELEAKLRSELASWDAAHPKPSADDKRMRTELQKRLEQLAVVEKTYADPGPLFDCVVFHDGHHWRAVVDVDEDGDLAEETPLTDFPVERGLGTFPFGSLLSFAVHVYDEGDTLSLVVDSGMHGTHVAGIVAGHFPDQPERNGVAPGARIVSVKIGDTRLGTMETEAGFTRGLAAVLQHDCDLINLSYGEATSTPNRGWLIDRFTEVVDEHGVTFVASAGNEGPALSTVGAPGGTTSATLGVGAYVSPAMMRAAYALRESLPETAYTWSSRGPTTDGAAGVDVYAPGGAIAPVPQWSLLRHQRMNGTSMASPNACGAVALLISAAKGENVSYTPYSLRRALQNTTRPVTGFGFAIRPGLIQIDRAWSHLEAHTSAIGEQLPFDVAVGDARDRGILLREPHETRSAFVTTVRVKPRFREDTLVETRVKFELPLRLSTTADWIETGEFLLLSDGGQSFEVRVDPTGLEPGHHGGFVVLEDPAAPERGPVLRVPVTVVKSEAVPATGHVTSEPTAFEPATTRRRFLAVPESATWVDVTLKAAAESTSPRRFVLHTVQLDDGESFEKHQLRRYITLDPGETSVVSLPVAGGRTLEVCLGQYWSSLGTGDVTCDVQFHGLRPSTDHVQLTGRHATANVTVSALETETLAPDAALTTCRRTYAPKRSQLRALTDARDRLPDGSPLHELQLFYDVTQTKTGTVTVHVPAEDLLYDSPLGGHTWALFDEHGRRIAFDDVYPDPVRLPKGRHQLVLRLRHEDVRVLERAKSWTVAIDRALSKTTRVTVFDSRAAAGGNGRAFRGATLPADGTRSLTLAAPNTLPAGVKPGDELRGTITFGRANSQRDGSGRRPGGYPLSWIIPATESVTVKPSSPVAVSASTSLTDREAAIRELDVKRLAALAKSKNDAAFDAVYEELRERYPDHLPIVLVKLKRLDDEPPMRKRHLPAIVSLCDEVLTTIDSDAVALEFGRRVDESDPKAASRRKRFEKQRELLTDTLYRKGRALGYMELPDVIARHPVEDPEAHDAAFESTFRELAQWVDTTEKRWVLLHVRRDRRRDRFGHALEQLNRRIASDGASYWLSRKRRDVYEQLGWTHAWEHERRRLAIAFPNQSED